MPWLKVETVEMRLTLVQEFRQGLTTMSELADLYGISRKTGYKWVERHDRDGVAGLEDQSRRPHHHPKSTAPDIVDALMQTRRRFPHWSAAKLVTWLTKHQPEEPWPCRATAYELLRRVHGRTARRLVPKPHRPPMTRVLTPATMANELWTTDFKGHFRTGDHAVCHPLTLRDADSRYVLACDGLANESIALTRPCFERAFRTYGLPTRMRMDNGRPFTGPGLAGLTALSVWWVRLGIALERITPGHPEQNGAHEQFHAVLKRQTARPPAATRQAQQRRFNAFRREYNEQRPHDALQGDPPASRYQASVRAFPRRLPALEYPGHYEVRRVATNGTVSWRNRSVFISEALRGESLGFEEIDDACWTVRLGIIRLALFNERDGTWS
jgi:putative transposase